MVRYDAQAVVSTKVLLVEDDPDHVELVMRSFEDMGFTEPISVAIDGEEALDYLDRLVGDGGELPKVTLLDLRLPKLDGLRVLEKVRGDARFDRMPVVVLTSSTKQSDLDEVYRLRANSFLVKPFEQATFNAVVTTLGEYWVQWNQVP